MSCIAMMVVDLCASRGLPEEIIDKILRQVFKIPKPNVNERGNVVASVKNIWRCPRDYVLKTIEQMTIPGSRPVWYHEIIFPKQDKKIYNRQVCIWKPEYYEIPIERRGIEVLKSWVSFEWHSLVIKTAMDRTNEEWIGFRTWLQTHPIYSKCGFFVTPMGNSNRNKRYSHLTKHWFKYELALAYPTLYGENGWAKLKK